MATTTETEKRVVVVGVDESDDSDNAFEYYMANLYLPTDHVIMVHCPEYHAIEYSMDILKDESALRAVVTKHEERMKRVLEKYAFKLRAKDIGGRVKSMAGKPGESIVQVANEEKAWMIVIGTRGIGGIRRTLLGTVSDYVIHHASCPVMVCKYKGSSQERRRSSTSGVPTRRKSIFNMLIKKD